MPRTIDLGPNELIVHLTGLIHFESLTAVFRIPYKAIASVSTEPFDAPIGMLRLLGSSIPFTDIREGHFYRDGLWYFLSFEDRSKTVTLTLKGFTRGRREYRAVVLGVDSPVSLKQRIDSRLVKVPLR